VVSGGAGGANQTGGWGQFKAIILKAGTELRSHVGDAGSGQRGEAGHGVRSGWGVERPGKAGVFRKSGFSELF
jgi:hypothetical protein